MVRRKLSVMCVLLLVVAASATWAQTADEGINQTNETPSITPELAKPSEPGSPYTSVIIDVTGMNLKRSMSPKIKQADGTEVWGTVKIDMDFLEEHGLVAYTKSMEDAKKSSRCGSNPMVIKAISVSGSLSSDPVIASEDAKLLLEENDKGKFLDKFDVIFVQCSQPLSAMNNQK